VNRAERRALDKVALKWAQARQAKAIQETGSPLTESALAEEFMAYTTKYLKGMEIVKHG